MICSITATVRVSRTLGRGHTTRLANAQSAAQHVGGWIAKVRIQGFNRQGWCKQIALKLVAALLGQEIALGERFNPLGHHLQAQTLRHRNDGA